MNKAPRSILQVFKRISVTDGAMSRQVLERAEGLAGTSMRQGFHLQNKEIDRTDELLKSAGYQRNQVCLLDAWVGVKDKQDIRCAHRRG